MRRIMVVLALTTALTAFAAEIPEAKGTIEAVTLYRGQALVTRVVPVNAAAGRVELLVGDLPEQVVADSVFAEAPAGVDVRAVRIRARAVGEEPREAVRKLDADLEAVQAKIARNARLSELAQQRLNYLDKLANFVAPAATVEMSKGVLNADALKGATLFDFEQRKAAAEESLTLAVEARELAKQVTLLQKQRAEVTSGTSHTVREAVLFLDKAAPGATTVRLSYLTNNAGWSPSYNFRAEKDGKEVRAEYNALIYQQTGEDWTGVSLTLSTASPALSAEGPGLAPFRVTLAHEAPRQQSAQAGQNYENLKGLSERNWSRQNQAEQKLSQSYNRDLLWKNAYDMNSAAAGNQLLELENPKDVLSQVFQDAARTEGPSVSYLITGPVSLASRSDQQLVRISDLKLAGHLYYVASPVLVSYVYREAELTNEAIDALLAGPVNAYLDGRFVGRGEIPSVAKGETFVVGFGADGQLRARRELVDKSENLQGGNREQNYKYRLVIDNFKDAAVTVRLQDRIPVAQRETDIRVTLGPSTDTLSEDKVYLRVERPKGILRWEVEAPAHASGEKAKVVEYAYKLEYDRNLRLSSPIGAQQQEQQEEFRKLQEGRSKKK